VPRPRAESRCSKRMGLTVNKCSPSNTGQFKTAQASDGLQVGHHLAIELICSADRFSCGSRSGTAASRLPAA
jgi:hypothetical protein